VNQSGVHAENSRSSQNSTENGPQRSARTIVEHGNLKAKSTATGPTTILKLIESDLLKFIFELREQGFAISISSIVIKASGLLPKFQQKSSEARYQSVRRWIRKHRMGTHESKRAPSKMASLAEDYVQTICPKILQCNRHTDFILDTFSIYI
jgi:hypothetical protein